ncbi:hypothetical protein BDZ94DRAFT_1321476 [Collybia nuda]|uniref:Uncharacterized protein n=1 Tax=Collybia nuda TaxID=64659 RepID=A0A9P5Y5Y8_9AGAR|nr:hypothetical protein BDZ94DRAFT_1321476 [Collybia nuda]
MDQRELHGLVEEMVRYSRGLPPPPLPRPRKKGLVTFDTTKRHGTYFPSKASFHTKWNFSDDDASTWEFSAPVAPTSRGSSSSSSDGSESTAYGSPAQEIALKYRAGMSLDFVHKRSGSESSVDSGVAWETAPLDDSSSDYAPIVSEEDEIKAIYRRSRFEALDDTREEAIAAMHKDGKNEHDNLVCHRSGCRDTVRDVRALMYHLHIHNIHDQTLPCTACGGLHDGDCSLDLDRVQSRIQPAPPPSPLKAAFARVFSRIVPHI